MVAKKAQTEATSPQPLEGPSTAPVTYYGVNTAEQQASFESPPAMWRRRNVIPLKPPSKLSTYLHPQHFYPKWGLSVND